MLNLYLNVPIEGALKASYPAVAVLYPAGISSGAVN